MVLQFCLKSSLRTVVYNNLCITVLKSMHRPDKSMCVGCKIWATGACTCQFQGCYLFYNFFSTLSCKCQKTYTCQLKNKTCALLHPSTEIPKDVSDLHIQDYSIIHLWLNLRLLNEKSKTEIRLVQMLVQDS